MAGSLSHIVNQDGTFSMDLIENLGDAKDALEECYNIIYELAAGDSDKIGAVCDRLDYPNPWRDRYGDGMTEPMKKTSGSR